MAIRAILSRFKAPFCFNPNMDTFYGKQRPQNGSEGVLEPFLALILNPQTPYEAVLTPREAPKAGGADGSAGERETAPQSGRETRNGPHRAQKRLMRA